MKKLISSERLYDAFVKAELGNEEHYGCWTPLWAVRSKIWSDATLNKEARGHSLGDLVKTAIEEGNSALFRQLADALDVMKIFERRPAHALRADIFFSIEELNERRRSFTKADLLTWLNDELDTGVTMAELDRELELMDLAEVIPATEDAGKK